MNIIFVLITVFILLVLLFLTKASHDTWYVMKAQEEKTDVYDPKEAVLEEKISKSRIFIYTGIAICFLALFFMAYLFIKDTMYAGHFHEWMNIIVRWLHITFGIAWIGTSFLFVFMENTVKASKDRPELKGNMWMLHGGGFFYVEKYKVAPKEVPKVLHWFKYEAYFTWLSGFMLLFVVYYFNAKAMLVDPTILDIPPYVGVIIGVSSLVVGYTIYHLLSLTPLLKKPVWFGLVGFIILVGFAWFYCQVFSARAAYIHFGALIGTLMAGNVFFVIIPSQKAMVKAARDGSYLDPALGQFAGLRSFHNNYFTLPVLFVMISNHFPSTFGHEYPWLVLAILTLGSAGVKHYFNLREKEQHSVWVMPISILILLSVVFITAPEPIGGECDSKVAFTKIYSIFNERCVTCHSSKPTDDTWTSPPNGVVYDTPQDIQKLTDKIMQRVVITKTMPQNNKTGITPEERELIRCWIEQGASIGE